MAEQCEHYTDAAQAGEAVSFRWTLPLTDAAAAGDALTLRAVVVLTDAAAAGDAFDFTAGVQLTDGATAGDALAIAMQLTRAYSDAAAAGDAFQARSSIALTDAATAGDALTYIQRRTYQITDSASAGDALSYTQRLIHAITDGATAGDAFEARSKVELTDAAAAGDALTWRSRLAKQFTDAAVGGDTFTHTLRYRATLTDAARAGDAITWAMAWTLALTDRAWGDDYLRTSVDVVDGAWTASTDLLAISQYTNTPSNSATYAYGLVMLGTPAGVVAMQGTTDFGDPIESQEMSTGLLDLADLAASERGGRPINQWRPDLLYLALTGEAGVVLTVGNTQSGTEEVSYDYEVPSRAAEVPVTNRVKIGRGMRNRYYRLALTTIDGAPYQLHDLTADALVTSRRL